MSAAPLRLLAEDDSRDAALSFGLDLTRYDRRLSLTGTETTALALLGTDGLRRSRARGAIRDDTSWSALARLARPLDDALGTLHHNDSRCTAGRRRCGGAGAGPLRRARQVRVVVDTGRLARAHRRRGHAVRRGDPVAGIHDGPPVRRRPGQLLGGFDQSHTIGMFDRLYLAGRVFGPEIVGGTLAKSPPRVVQCRPQQSRAPRSADCDVVRRRCG